MNRVRIVGLDPSLKNWGAARAFLDLDTLKVEIEELVLTCTEPEKNKAIKKVVRKNSEDLERVRLLYTGLQHVCRETFLAIAEVPVGSQSARAMASYGMCVGVLASCPVPLIQVTPSEVKVAATGCKTATKEEMIEWAMQRHPGANWLTVKRGGKLVPTAANEHLADACGAIEAGIQTDQFKQAIALYRATVRSATAATVDR